MYLEFYGLITHPFLSMTSRPFLLGDEYKKAMMLLTYGILERKGFSLLTGDAGIGKTTLLQAIVAGLESNVICACIADPNLTVKDLFTTIARVVFQDKAHFEGKADFLFAFEGFLNECHRQQKTFLLVVDEAHRISLELLEEIRLLSNTESGERRVMSICLAGQPELNHKLSRPEFLPILQRISTRCHLKPFDLQTTRIYLETMLEQAGAENEIFTPQAVALIHEYSGGFPRVINVLAEDALLLGYERSSKRIAPNMIRGLRKKLQVSSSAESGVVEPKPLKFEIEQVRPFRRHYMRWGVAAAFVLLLSLTGLFYGERVQNSVTSVLRTQGSPPAEAERMAGLSTSSTDKAGEMMPVQLAIPLRPPDTKPSEVFPVDRQEKFVESAVVEPAHLQPEAIRRAASERVKVKAGDTLRKLTMAIYGRADRDILNSVKRANPGLSDTDRILIGQILVFPPAQDLIHHTARTELSLNHAP